MKQREGLDPAAVVERALDAARRAGADEVDAVAVEYDSSRIGVRLGELETVKMSRERRLGIRCLSGKATAVASTADLAEAAIEEFARDVVEMARVVAPDPDACFPAREDLATDHPDLALADTALELTPERRIELARACEAAALASDPRLTNSEGGSFTDGRSHVAFASTSGFRGDYASTSYGLSVSPVARQNGEMQRDYWFDRSRFFADLADPEEIGRIAAERTLRRLGARKVPTQEAAVVFDPQTAASLVGHVASAVSGGALYRRASFLLDRLGSTIASREVSIVDDGRLRAGLASRPFDGEGVATRRNAVVEQGVLTSYLLDSYSARKLGLATTGNAARGLGDVPSASPSNFLLLAGPHSPEDIIASVERGLYVTHLSGFGVNGVTGDYSRGASGIWIENGKLTHAVEEVTIAGNLLQMLAAIEMVGSDLTLRSSICAPTVKIQRMTIAGA